MSWRNCVFRPARPRMNRRMPLEYAFAAAMIDGGSFGVPSLHAFGSPSVARMMTGGEPAGGGFAMKSATTASIDGAVGVLPPGCWLAIRVAIAVALFFAREAVE